MGILGYVVHKRVWLWFHSFSFDTIEENCYSVFYISNNPSYLKLLWVVSEGMVEFLMSQISVWKTENHVMLAYNDMHLAFQVWGV